MAPVVDDTVATPEQDGLHVGPIAGLTTVWHRAPLEFTVPIGTQLEFRCPAVPGAVLNWDGAETTSERGGFAYASCPAQAPGVSTIRVTVTSNDGKVRTEWSRVRVIDVRLEDIKVTPVEARVRNLSFGPGRKGDGDAIELTSVNEVTMGLFFAEESIAALGRTDDGRYLTSVARTVLLRASIEPPALDEIMEWRVDGTVVGLGPDAAALLPGLGVHEVNAGPLASPGVARVQTYEVEIVGHTLGNAPVDDGMPVTFTAVTNPPGFEDHITWLSSTKYGAGTPIMGEGPNFDVVFDNTWGVLPEDESVGFQWLGVKADNTVFNQDVKCAVTASFTQLDSNAPLTPPNRMVSNAQSGLDDVQYRVNVSPPGCTVLLGLTGVAVTFSDGSTTKSNVTDGTVVTIKAAANATGVWNMTASNPGPGLVASTGEQVFKFACAFSLWAHSPGTVLVPGNGATATANGSGGVSTLSAATSGAGSTGDLGDQTSAQDDAQSNVSIVTVPPGMFDGQVQADVRIEQFAIYGGTMYDFYLNNGATGAGSLTVGPFSFPFNFSTDGVGFMGRTALRVNGVPSYGAIHEVKSTNLGQGFFTLSENVLTTMGTGVPGNIWTVGAGATSVSVRSAVVTVVKKHGESDYIENGSAHVNTQCYINGGFTIQP